MMRSKNRQTFFCSEMTRSKNRVRRVEAVLLLRPRRPELFSPQQRRAPRSDPLH